MARGRLKWASFDWTSGRCTNCALAHGIWLVTDRKPDISGMGAAELTPTPNPHPSVAPAAGTWSCKRSNVAVEVRLTASLPTTTAGRGGGASVSKLSKPAKRWLRRNRCRSVAHHWRVHCPGSFECRHWARATPLPAGEAALTAGHQRVEGSSQVGCDHAAWRAKGPGMHICTHQGCSHWDGV